MSASWIVCVVVVQDVGRKLLHLLVSIYRRGEGGGGGDIPGCRIITPLHQLQRVSVKGEQNGIGGVEHGKYKHRPLT